MRLPALVLLALLLTVGLVPSVHADVNAQWAHRYVLFGRVVDSDGQAVKGVLVDAGLDPAFGAPRDCGLPAAGSSLESLGTERTQRFTGDHGDFLFCFLVDELKTDISRMLVKVNAADFVTEVAFDPVARVSFANIQLPIPLPDNRTDALNTSYTVIARLYTRAPADAVEDGVRVLARPRAGEPVDVGILLPNGTVYQGTTRSNDFGDIAVDIPLAARPMDGSVRIRAAGETKTYPLDNVTGMSGFRLELPQPSSTIPAPAGVLLVAPAIALALALRRRS